MFIGIIRQKKPDREEKRTFRAAFSAALSGWVRVISCNDYRSFFRKRESYRRPSPALPEEGTGYFEKNRYNEK
jgi:hypothetical protein